MEYFESLRFYELKKQHSMLQFKMFKLFIVYQICLNSCSLY